MITGSSRLYSHQQVDDHRKKRKPHIQNTQQTNRRVSYSQKIFLSHMHFHSQLYTHHPSMLRPSKQYTKTRRDSSGYV